MENYKTIQSSAEILFKTPLYGIERIVLLDFIHRLVSQKN